MKKRIVGTLLALLLAVTVLPPGAISVTSADVTTGLVTTAYADEHYGGDNHPICGKECSHSVKHGSVIWEPYVSGQMKSGTKDKPNYYYLTGDIKNEWRFANEYVVICLNGHNITSESGQAIQVLSVGNLTITDCMPAEQQGSITHAGNATGKGVFVQGVFNMYGGRIIGNTNTSGNGGGVYVQSGKTFNMYGGTISGNTANAGGGVYVAQNAKFNMTGGTISGNKAEATGSFDGNGGGVYVQDGTFNMDGGLISGNAASESNCADGGGVFVIGNFTMSDGTISGNKAYRGAGVQVGDYYPNGRLGSGTFTMTGGIIGGTTADAANIATYGGGVNVWSTGTFDLRSGSIIGNEANGTVDENGGGVHSNGTFNVSGDPIVKGNTREIQGSTYADNVDSSNEAINVVGALTGNAGVVVNRTSKTKITGVATYYSAIPNDDGSVTLKAPTGSSGGETDVAVESVTLNKQTLRMGVNDTRELFATVMPTNATNRTVTWTSSDPTVATVDEYGTVTGVKVGTATITAMAGGKSATCAVTVSTTYVEATEVLLSPTTAEIKVGESVQLTATVEPDNATDKTVIWSSYNAEIATVDANGLVKGLKAGEVSIFAMTVDGRGATCNVTVTDDTPKPNTCTISFDANGGSGTMAAVTVEKGSTYQLPANGFTAPEGKKFKGWAYSAKDVSVINSSIRVVDSFTLYAIWEDDSSSGGDTPTPTPEAPRYYYSSGSGSSGAGGLSAVQNDPNGKSATDYSGGIYGLLFRTNAALSAFRGVQVDGVTIGAANYSVEGNEVYLKAVYLQTLANGKHTLTVLSGEGDATAQFTVGGVVSAPKTADAGALAYLGLALSSYMGTALATRRKKEF